MTALIPILASTIGKIFQPIFQAMAYMLAFFYALIPNYAIAISLLTILVMALTAPLTIKSTLSMASMQRIAPELKKLQQKYKGDRQRLNEEMMALYRENGVNPAGGCLPMLLQLPLFLILYDCIRGLTTTIKQGALYPPGFSVSTFGQKCLQTTCATPRYIGHSTKLFSSLIDHNGKMPAFGIDLTERVLGHHSIVSALPYAALIAVAIALQYFQMRQLNSRNPAMAQANPQMQMMQRYMPLLFAVIYINIPAAVNVYFIFSNACRIGIQEFVFRSGMLDRARAGSSKAANRLPGRAGGGPSGGRRGLMERLADAQRKALEAQQAHEALRAELEAAGGSGAEGSDKPKSAEANDAASGAKGQGATSGPARSGSGPQNSGRGSRPGSPAGNGSARNEESAPKPAHPRPKAKKTRKAR